MSDAEKDCGKGEGEDKNKDWDDFNKDFWARKDNNEVCEVHLKANLL